MKNLLKAALVGGVLLTASNAYAFDMMTLGKGIIIEEAKKCTNGVFKSGGCIGPNGFIVKTLKNAASDIKNGPGDHNDLVGKKGIVRRVLGF